MQYETDNIINSHSASVLYVDDETLSLKHFRLLMSPLVNVHVAKNPLEAWQILNTKGQEISIIVSDQRMPFENGLTFLNDVKRQHPQIARILFSAFLSQEVVSSAVSEGAIDGFIEKPCQPERMIEIISALLSQQKVQKLSRS